MPDSPSRPMSSRLSSGEADRPYGSPLAAGADHVAGAGNAAVSAPPDAQQGLFAAHEAHAAFVPATPAPVPAGVRRAGQRRAASPDLAEGHRQRLRQRFDRGERLADYELLELLLFRPIPRRDTKPVAKAMIAEFGSFAGALSAPAARLTEIDGVGERVVSDFRLVRAAAERLALAELAERPVLSSTDAVAGYFRTKLAGLPREEFHILFLDKKNRFLADECAGVGTVDHAPVYPREVLTRALALSASGIVLVHNHPSGDPTPSRADIAITRKIVEAMAPVGIAVHDHIIVAGAKHLSMRGEGLF